MKFKIQKGSTIIEIENATREDVIEIAGRLSGNAVNITPRNEFRAHTGPEYTSRSLFLRKKKEAKRRHGWDDGEIIKMVEIIKKSLLPSGQLKQGTAIAAYNYFNRELKNKGINTRHTFISTQATLTCIKNYVFLGRANAKDLYLYRRLEKMGYHRGMYKNYVPEKTETSSEKKEDFRSKTPSVYGEVRIE